MQATVRFCEALIGYPINGKSSAFKEKLMAKLIDTLHAVSKREHVLDCIAVSQI